MLRVVTALFLVAHGLVHLLYLAPRPEDDPHYPFVPEGRWFARVVGLEPSSAKRVSGALAVVCALAFLISGIALLANADVWKPATVAGAAVSLALMLLFFHPWLSIGIAIDVAIIADVLVLQVPASIFEG